MLYIEPVSGLANRMRVIAASRQLLNSIGFLEPNDLQCIWHVNNDLAAGYLDLFEVSDSFELCNPFKRGLHSTQKDLWYKKWWSHLLDKCQGVDFYYSCADIDRIMGVRTPSQNNKLFFEIIKESLLKHNTVCFTGYHYFMDLDEVTIFTPHKEIMMVIDDFSHCFNNRTFGLHIRRTDNTVSISSSPTSLFKKKIESLLSVDSSSRFYLSTDDPSVQEELVSEYGSCILCREKTYGRDSLAGMKDAVADMWLLSRTIKIYGSYYSSFSRMASLVGCHNLEVLKA